MAFTRAKQTLIILADKLQDFLNEPAELGTLAIKEEGSIELIESKRRAFDLFVNGKFEQARVILENRENWIKSYFENYFASINHISFSSLPENPFDYFVYRILRLQGHAAAAKLGSDLHESARRLLLGESFEVPEEQLAYFNNVKQLLAQIQKDYPEFVAAEFKLEFPLEPLGFESGLAFVGYIDAIFKKGNQLPYSGLEDQQEAKIRL